MPSSLIRLIPSSARASSQPSSSVLCRRLWRRIRPRPRFITREAFPHTRTRLHTQSSSLASSSFSSAATLSPLCKRGDSKCGTSPTAGEADACPLRTAHVTPLAPTPASSTSLTAVARTAATRPRTLSSTRRQRGLSRPSTPRWRLAVRLPLSSHGSQPSLRSLRPPTRPSTLCRRTYTRRILRYPLPAMGSARLLPQQRRRRRQAAYHFC